jgi:hypothetical protein
MVADYLRREDTASINKLNIPILKNVSGYPASASRMKQPYQLIVICVSCLLLSCASIPGDTPSPWDFPNRGYSISSSAEQVHLVASMKPCIDFARSTFPEVLSRFERGLSEGAALKVIVFDDEKYTSQVTVWTVEDNLIHGRISRRHTIEGKLYAPGDNISINQSEIVDWYIIHKDRPAEGNMLGKYLLLKQDGLAAGACDPHDIEFQRFRFFAKNYSLVPPGTDGWEMRVPREGQDMLMLEKGAGPNELNTLSSTRYKFPLINSKQELVDTTRGFMEYVPEDPDRYTIIEHEIVTYTKKETMPGNFNSLALCVVSSQIVTDMRALLLKSGEKGIMIRETQTLVCVHPTERDRAVVLNYSHRYQPGNRDPEFIDKARQVFESIAFKTRN